MKPKRIRNDPSFCLDLISQGAKRKVFRLAPAIHEIQAYGRRYALAFPWMYFRTSILDYPTLRVGCASSSLGAQATVEPFVFLNTFESGEVCLSQDDENDPVIGIGRSNLHKIVYSYFSTPFTDPIGIVNIPFLPDLHEPHDVVDEWARRTRRHITPEWTLIHNKWRPRTGPLKFAINLNASYASLSH